MTCRPRQGLALYFAPGTVSVSLLLACSLALAQEELPKLEAEVKHRANPTFPQGASAGPLGTVRCVVRAVVQPDGLPSEAEVVEVSDCPEPFASSASDAVMRWRWAPIEEASWVKVAVTFRLRTSLGGSVAPEDLAALVEAHDVRPDEQAACRILATIHPDGEVSGLTTNRSPACLAVPTLALPPKRLVKKAGGLQVRCTVAFRVNAQGAWVTGVAADCPPSHTAFSKSLVQRWRWNRVLEDDEDDCDYVATFTYALE